MVKVSLVSYLNAKPFLYGINTCKEELNISVSLDVPSECARKLVANEVDIGLVPVAILPTLKEKYIISDYCIGAFGKVSSVMLYSNVPLQQIKTIVLDFQSKTSVTLVKILAKYLWNIYPEFISAQTDNDLIANDAKAFVMIGDRTFNINGKYKFEFNLAEEWFKLTQMPFVFACWVANKKLENSLIEKFNYALKVGVEKRKSMISIWQNEYAFANVEDYLMNKIRYEFGDIQKTALDTFLKYISQ